MFGFNKKPQQEKEVTFASLTPVQIRNICADFGEVLETALASKNELTMRRPVSLLTHPKKLIEQCLKYEALLADKRGDYEWMGACQSGLIYLEDFMTDEEMANDELYQNMQKVLGSMSEAEKEDFEAQLNSHRKASNET
jgi:hypothetical protein